MAHKLFSSRRAWTDRSVTVLFDIREHSFGGSVAAKGNAVISSEQAREFAAELISAADESDAKADKKEAAEMRRKAWRDREIAAGRMKVFGVGDFFK